MGQRGSSQIPNLAGKTCIVTGANSGLGLATAKRLAALNAHVVCTVRDPQKGENALRSIQDFSPNAKADYMVLELESFQSVRDFVIDFQKKHSHLHILINNAGMSLVPDFQQTEDEFEKTFQVNYLSPFLLTNSLIDQMIESVPDKNVKGYSRIINVVSKSQKYASDSNILLNEDQWNSKEKYNQAQAYCYSKLALGLYTTQLYRNLQKYKKNGGCLTVNSVNPGGMATNFYRNIEQDKKKYLQFFKIIRVLADPNNAAQYLIHLAASDRVSDVSGEYFDKTRMRPLGLSIRDVDKVSEELWNCTRVWTHKRENIQENKE